MNKYTTIMARATCEDGELHVEAKIVGMATAYADPAFIAELEEGMKAAYVQAFGEDPAVVSVYPVPFIAEKDLEKSFEDEWYEKHPVS